jgi:hypothetical protein
MLSQKIIVALFAVFISLGLTGMALAEPFEASYVSQSSSFDSYNSHSHSVGELGDIEASAAPADSAPADSGMQKDNEPRVRCASFDIGEKVDSNDNSTVDCKTLYGV